MKDVVNFFDLKRLLDTHDLDFRATGDGVQINRCSLLSPDPVTIPWELAEKMTPEQMYEHWRDAPRHAVHDRVDYHNQLYIEREKHEYPPMVDRLGR